MRKIVSIAVIGAISTSISFANNYNNQYYQPTEHLAYANTQYQNPYYSDPSSNAGYQLPPAVYQSPATMYYEQYPQEYYTGLPQQYPTYNPNYGYNPYNQVQSQQPVMPQYQQPVQQYQQPQYQPQVQQYQQPQYQQQPLVQQYPQQQQYYQQQQMQQAPKACGVANQQRAVQQQPQQIKQAQQQPKPQRKKLNTAGTINQITKFITDQLSRNKDFKNISKSRIAVASFVTAENLGKSNKLGRMISQNMIHDLQIRGYDVVDYKTSIALRVAADGDFIFTNDKKKMKKKQAINYVVSGTMEYFGDGVTVNARIIKMKDNKVVSTAQAFIPHHIVAEVLDTLDPYMAFHSKGRLSTIRIVGE
jgi:TolB-like protein